MLRGQRDKKEPVKELKRSRGVGGKPGTVASLLLREESVARSRE